jgi:hypothetical protein
MMMTKVNIDLWVLLAGVALPSACLLMVSLVYCWRRLSRRRRQTGGAHGESAGFDRQVLLEMVLQQTDNALNSIVDAVQAQRIEMLNLLETHRLPLPTATPPAAVSVLETEPVADHADEAPSEASAEVSAAVSAAPPAASGVQAPPPPASPGAAKAGKGSDPNTLFDPYRQIPDHIHAGLSISEVAGRLDLPESAVELYVSLRMPEMKGGRQKRA